MSPRLPCLVLLLVLTSPAFAAPDLEAGGLQEIQDRLEGFRGTPVVLNFWATWCKPCVHELPLLAKLHEEYGDEVTFWAVSMDTLVFEEDEARDRVARMVDEHQVPYGGDLYVGDANSISEAFDLRGMLPTTIFLDAKGNEVHRIRGLLQENAVRRQLEQLTSSR